MRLIAFFGSLAFLLCNIGPSNAQDRFKDSERIIREELAVTVRVIGLHHDCISAVQNNFEFLGICKSANDGYFNEVFAKDLGIYLDVLGEKAEMSGRVSDLELGNEFMFRVSELRRLHPMLENTMTEAQKKEFWAFRYP